MFSVRSCATPLGPPRRGTFCIYDTYLYIYYIHSHDESDLVPEEELSLYKSGSGDAFIVRERRKCELETLRPDLIVRRRLLPCFHAFILRSNSQ